MFAIPVDEGILFDSGSAVRCPKFDHPEQSAQVLVDPVLRATDYLLRVVFEVMPDAECGITGLLTCGG
ncbi:MAG: hypothetical protein EBW47_11325 [Betaproteobacteria bacterium]|nr:hypothetical protein [Betaproteobacteria bacterium]